ncbi:type VI secretion system-associated protein TagF [Azohydromonas aeria]|uniref:type VI secretion system-associated protein TagF n=1 Tax=Azohydromonas aeria TaxID=2590212 RepID=UPI0012F878DE|nr:type VI secretion system-associated protein TagF [Azohydromonas aeria]
MALAAPLDDAGSAGAPGWYGKLAALGDFARRRLAPEVSDACDAWLSAGMRAGQERLGTRWLEIYLTAPLLRFAWAPGVQGPSWWFGVLMPSCDAVGRYFPLLVVQARAQPPADRPALEHLEAWYEAVAQAALHTLGARASVESFEAALQTLPPWPVPRMPPAPPCSLGEWALALALREAQARLSGCSLWWRGAQGDGALLVKVSRGLPRSEEWSGLLLDDNWITSPGQPGIVSF